MDVYENLICAENFDFDNNVFPRLNAQVWMFVLNKSRIRLIRLRVDSSKRLGSFMLKILQKKCIQFYEMKISASVQIDWVSQQLRRRLLSQGICTVSCNLLLSLESIHYG